MREFLRREQGVARRPQGARRVPWSRVSGPRDGAYPTALLDWLGCAVGGWEERAARAARTAGHPVVALGTAGPGLDYDDTHPPGLAHLSAPVAPVGLLGAAERGAGGGEGLEAVAAGFEAPGAGGRACHP